MPLRAQTDGTLYAFYNCNGKHVPINSESAVMCNLV